MRQAVAADPVALAAGDVANCLVIPQQMNEPMAASVLAEVAVEAYELDSPVDLLPTVGMTPAAIFR